MKYRKKESRNLLREFTLTLGQTVELGKKGRKGHGGTIGVVNHGVPFSGEARNRKCHGDAVIAARRNLSSAQLSRVPPLHSQTVRALFDFRTHATQIFRHVERFRGELAASVSSS